MVPALLLPPAGARRGTTTVAAPLSATTTMLSCTAGFTNVIVAFAVKGGDPDEMADRLAAILEDPGLASRLGAQARRTVRERFSMDAMVRAYLEVLRG